MGPLLIMILLSFAVSFDSFFFGLTFQVRTIKIPLRVVLLIGMMTGISFLIGSLIGSFLLYMLPHVADYLGGAIFTAIGLWILWQWAVDQKEKVNMLQTPWTFTDIWMVLKEPQVADYDRSGSIHGFEAFVVAFALSLDSFASGVGATFTNLPVLLLGSIIGSFSIIFLLAGIWTGKWLQQFKIVHLLAFLPGVILIGIGMINIIR